MEFEKRQRPEQKGKSGSFMQALRETLTTGEALFVPLNNGKSKTQIMGSTGGFRPYLALEGLKLRARGAEDGVYFWVEKMAAKAEGR